MIILDDDISLRYSTSTISHATDKMDSTSTKPEWLSSVYYIRRFIINKLDFVFITFYTL